MKAYNIEITKESLDELLDTDNLDQSNKLKGSKWFKLIEDQIVKVEGEDLRNLLSVNRGRYYPDSKRATAYIIIYLKCRKCKDLSYIVKLTKKPEPYHPIIFTVEKSDEHDIEMHNIPTARVVRREERIELAKELLTHHGGSAKAYFETEVGKVDSAVPPSQDVIRKVLLEYNNKDNLPYNPQGLNMIGNLLHAAITAKASMPRKSLSGYIHEIMIHDKFGMTLCMEEQLEALHCVPVNDRILHFDATEGLVKAKGDGVEYGQILTYAIIAQNIKKLGNNQILFKNNQILFNPYSNPN